MTDDGVNVSTTYYTIGDDVLAQTVDGTTDYLLYDGHGSTRQLVDSTGTIVTGQQYNYDAYGVMLGDSTTPYPAQSAATNLLYSGEQYDSNLDQYYLRARYYNQNNGTFNRVDPYAGDMQDPQSLHKYAYVHNNPVNNIDPTGNFTIAGQLAVISIQSIMYSIIGVTVGDALTGGNIVAGFSEYLSYLFSWGTWAIAAMSVFDGILELFNSPAAVIKMIASAILSKIFVVYGALTSIWDMFSSAGMIKGLFEAGAPREYVMSQLALITASLIIGVLASFLIGKAIKAIGAKGYKTFEDFKKAHGSAGEGMAWHHIVEQNPANLKKFRPEQLHNTKNIVKLPHGKGSIHAKISGYYSSKPDFTGGKTVRDWLSTKSFRYQYKHGVDAIRRFGGEI